ncbi:MAG: SMP-30/gluconolactonase/LRE family protein [Hyphomicrobiaceae bacterium]
MSWFPVPETIPSKVFTPLPDRFRAAKRTLWADFNKGGAEVDSFLEGPAFDRAGNLYVTDIPNGRIFRIDRAGGWEHVATYDGWPNGLKIAADGRILITDYKRGLVVLDPGSGSVTPHYTYIRSESFKGVNDLVISGSGDIFFTDQGQTGMQDPSGRVYRLTVDGRLERLLDTCPSPNGIALDPTEGWIYVALTRACQIWRMPVTRDSVTGKVNVFAHMPGGMSGPDGLAVDEEGGLAVANPGHGCIWLLDRHGVPRFRVESCGGRTITNVAYDPKDLHRLVFTDSDLGQVLEARVPIRGLLLASHG